MSAPTASSQRCTLQRCTLHPLVLAEYVTISAVALEHAHWRVRSDAVEALAHLAEQPGGIEPTVRATIPLLRHRRWRVRIAALRTLRKCVEVSGHAINAMLDVSETCTGVGRGDDHDCDCGGAAALRAVVRTRSYMPTKYGKRLAKVARNAVIDGGDHLREVAVDVLGEFGDFEDIDVHLQDRAAHDSSYAVRMATVCAAIQLSRRGPERGAGECPASALLWDRLEDVDPMVRYEAVNGFAVLCGAQPGIFAVPLIPRLEDGSAMVRRAAAVFLGQVELDENLSADLRTYLSSQDFWVWHQLIAAVSKAEDGNLDWDVFLDLAAQVYPQPGKYANSVVQGADPHRQRTARQAVHAVAQRLVCSTQGGVRVVAETLMHEDKIIRIDAWKTVAEKREEGLSGVATDMLASSSGRLRLAARRSRNEGPLEDPVVFADSELKRWSLAQLEDDWWRVQRTAVDNLGRAVGAGDSSTTIAVVEKLRHGSALVRRGVVDVLSHLTATSEAGCALRLVSCLEDSSGEVRFAAVRALARAAANGGIEAGCVGAIVWRVITGDSGGSRRAAAAALIAVAEARGGALGGSVSNVLAAWLPEATGADAQHVAITTLTRVAPRGHCNGMAALARLATAAFDSDVRVAALAALEIMAPLGSCEVHATASRCATDESKVVQEAAVALLARLGLDAIPSPPESDTRARQKTPPGGKNLGGPTIGSSGSALHPGAAVRLHGLVARPDLNGAVGILERWGPGTRRWKVCLPGGVSKSVRPENLEEMQ